MVAVLTAAFCAAGVFGASLASYVLGNTRHQVLMVTGPVNFEKEWLRAQAYGHHFWDWDRAVQFAPAILNPTEFPMPDWARATWVTVAMTGFAASILPLVVLVSQARSPPDTGAKRHLHPMVSILLLSVIAGSLAGISYSGWLSLRDVAGPYAVLTVPNLLEATCLGILPALGWRPLLAIFGSRVLLSLRFSPNPISRACPHCGYDSARTIPCPECGVSPLVPPRVRMSRILMFAFTVLLAAGFLVLATDFLQIRTRLVVFRGSKTDYFVGWSSNRNLRIQYPDGVALLQIDPVGMKDGRQNGRVVVNWTPTAGEPTHKVLESVSYSGAYAVPFVNFRSGPHATTLQAWSQPERDGFHVLVTLPEVAAKVDLEDKPK